MSLLLETVALNALSIYTIFVCACVCFIFVLAAHHVFSKGESYMYTRAMGAFFIQLNNNRKPSNGYVLFAFCLYVCLSVCSLPSIYLFLFRRSHSFAPHKTTDSIGLQCCAAVLDFAGIFFLHFFFCYYRVAADCCDLWTPIQWLAEGRS